MSRHVKGVKCPKCDKETVIVTTKYGGYPNLIKCRRTTCDWLVFVGGIRGKVLKCPECESELKKRKYIDTWDVEDKPEQVTEYLVCDSCKIVWVPMDSESMFPYKTKK